jgi:two-component sensor histidine kinase
MHGSTEELFSPWLREIAQSIRTSQAFCLGLFSTGGEVLFINSALERLVGPSPTEGFVNPGFADLLAAAENASGRKQIFSGFATLSNGTSDTSILTRVYTEEEQILLLGEVDVVSLSGQYDSVVELNREINRLQRTLLQRKRELQQEIEERTSAQARVQALLDEKEIILREVHHRIKNNMNTVTSLLRLQIATHDNPDTTAILQDATHRVQSMTLLYDKLYRSSNMTAITLDEYLVPLLKQVIEIFPQGDRITLHTDIAAISCNPRYISSLGIVINELTTNAMKYAFPDIDKDQPVSDGARINLTAHRTNDLLHVEFSDNGCGLPPEITVESQGGFGMQLITMLVQQLRGTFRIERDGGTRFLIECPMPDS